MYDILKEGELKLGFGTDTLVKEDIGKENEIKTKDFQLMVGLAMPLFWDF